MQAFLCIVTAVKFKFVQIITHTNSRKCIGKSLKISSEELRGCNLQLPYKHLPVLQILKVFHTKTQGWSHIRDFKFYIETCRAFFSDKNCKDTICHIDMQTFACSVEWSIFKIMTSRRPISTESKQDLKLFLYKQGDSGEFRGPWASC